MQMNRNAPNPQQILRGEHRSKTVLSFLAKRRSTLARAMKAPGPDTHELETILRLAARVPDHRKLTPWRFIVFRGGARAAFGRRLKAVFRKHNPDLPPGRDGFESARFLRAPVIVAVVSSPKDCARGTPRWEQELSAGAVCMNMLLAARASGYAAQWLTEWYAYDPDIKKELGLTDAERIAGFLYMGTATEAPTERPRARMNELTRIWPQK